MQANNKNNRKIIIIINNIVLGIYIHKFSRKTQANTNLNIKANTTNH